MVAAETVNESTNSSDATKDFLNEAGVMAAVAAHLNFVSKLVMKQKQGTSPMHSTFPPTAVAWSVR